METSLHSFVIPIYKGLCVDVSSDTASGFTIGLTSEEWVWSTWLKFAYGLFTIHLRNRVGSLISALAVKQWFSHTMEMYI